MIDPWIKGATKLPDEFKDLSKLGKVDLILVMHGHGDHLGDAMEISKTNDVPMWAPAGLNQTLLTLGLMPAKLVPRMSKGGTIEPFPGVKITMVRAEHSPEMILKDPATGKDTSYAAGEPAGWIIELENGFRIYHMGDTGLFGDMKFIGEYYKPDLGGRVQGGDGPDVDPDRRHEPGRQEGVLIVVIPSEAKRSRGTSSLSDETPRLRSG